MDAALSSQLFKARMRTHSKRGWLTRPITEQVTISTRPHHQEGKRCVPRSEATRRLFSSHMAYEQVDEETTE